MAERFVARTIASLLPVTCENVARRWVRPIAGARERHFRNATRVEQISIRERSYRILLGEKVVGVANTSGGTVSSEGLLHVDAIIIESERYHLKAKVFAREQSVLLARAPAWR